MRKKKWPLWVIDGTSDGTTELQPAGASATYGLDPQILFLVGSQLFFFGGVDTNAAIGEVLPSNSLWVTNGTSEGMKEIISSGPLYPPYVDLSALPPGTLSGLSPGTIQATVVNNANGTSFLSVYNPTSTATETLTDYSGLNASGIIILTIVDNTDGTSYLYAYNPTNSVIQTTSEYSAPNDAGTKIADVVNNSDGTTSVYAYNPSSTASLTAQTWSGTDPANGAPSGSELSDILDNTDGTSILYAYNLSSSVTQTASFYSATDPSNGAPTGTVTREVLDFNTGRSSVTIGGTTTYYTGPDGTGSFAAGSSAPASTASAPAAGSSDMAVISFTGSCLSIDPGAGDHTIQFITDGTTDTLVLHLAGSDQVLGFDPNAEDRLDFSALLNEAGVNIGGDISRLSKDVSIVDTNGSAQILFDPTGQGGSSQVASLVNAGGLVAQLQTFNSFNV